jgi:hypothetical protein
MPVTYTDSHATFADEIAVEEAEALLEWLQCTPTARVNLAACTHLHAANLQVLMAAMPTITAWPRDDGLRGWIESALSLS